LSGRIGQYYNLEREQEGAFWGDRFHSTRIQSGAHLGQCMFYIDLNMVRARVVKHPEKWKHCGYQELISDKTRYSIINTQRLLQCLAFDDIHKFRKWYKNTLQDKLENVEQKRMHFWSEAVAVGDEDWLKDEAAEKSGLKRYDILNKEGICFIVGKKPHDKLKKA
jgi:REP-associated tyrosine transposase